MIYSMIPLRGLSILPHMLLHFDIGREKSIKALEAAMLRDKRVLLVSQKDENIDLPTADDIYKIGTVVKIKQMLKLPNDGVRVFVEGICRGKIEEILPEDAFFECIVDDNIEIETEEVTQKEEALMRLLLVLFEEYVEMREKNPKEIFGLVAGIKRGGQLADVVASYMEINVEKHQKILDEADTLKRLELVYKMLLDEVEIAGIERDISDKVRKQMDENQKNYYLREQMRAIQNELGFDEDIDEDLIKWNEQINELDLPKDVEKKVEKEIKKLSHMQPSSAEANVIRLYIETILSLPWNKLSDTTIDLKKAEKILNEDHYGLEKVKERVLEYLAVVELSKEIKGPIICLVGPPGTGKTSIAKSIARATGREFVRMSLGGVRDEAEIRGHRRTYIGAIPGRVINGIKDAGTRNPLFLFDEVDKLGADYKGDPSSALLEVLDPEQNKSFMDHYLEVPFDLSKVMFITTANDLNTIPRPLLDRMEVIEVTGYTEDEKVAIAKKYLISKKIKEHGLVKTQFSMSEKAIRDLINYYTRESGVRNLEREIANLIRKVAKKIVAGDIESCKITQKNLKELLGKRKYRYDKITGKKEIGVVTGLAWTIVGGDTLFIETSAVPGTGKLSLTGQLGDVMQESAKIGISYIRSVAKKLGIDENFYKEKDMHIHVPEGAVPKDGPSAGVTMCVAMISTLTNRPVKKDVAMTGEVTLRGNVLPVGGIKEKVLAAHRAGVHKVLLPADNESDIEQIPENVRNQMEFVLIKNVSEALKEALTEK